MPRARKPGAPEPKRRSRNGCWPCKSRKIKCGEEHPICLNCQKLSESCDYTLKLNWTGRRIKRTSQSRASIAEASSMPVESSLPSTLKRSHTFPTSTASLRSMETLAGFKQQQTAFSWVPAEHSEPEREESDGASPRVARVASSSSLFTFTTSAVSPRRNSIWSIRDGHPSTDASTASHGLASLAGMPPVRHKRAESLAEPSDDHRAWYSPSISSLSSYNTGSPYLPLQSVRSEFASMSHGSPSTPAASSVFSDEDRGFGMGMPCSPSISTRRRTSTSSMLRDAVDWRHHGEFHHILPPPMPFFHEKWVGDFQQYSFHGFDIGLRDDDIGKNDDLGCITAPSQTAWGVTGVLGRERDISYKGIDGYYEEPVPVLIPRDLEPLPAKLAGNRMNLLYFHHFLNHTAKVLTPHENVQYNPFRTILPKMAVQDDTLLSLLLAYSGQGPAPITWFDTADITPASHRARILQHGEPEMRIATWVTDIFPSLRRALDNANEHITDANLATAIVLASLEVISPTAFGFAIPWQSHLITARSLMKKRIASKRPTEDEPICSFLWSWLSYLDVMGALSGGAAADHQLSVDDDALLPLASDQAGGASSDHDLDEIDCVLGFTLRCLRLLARVADLIRRRGRQRAVAAGGSASVMETVRLAARLDQDLRNSMTRSPHPCGHVPALEAAEMRRMAAVNEAFHLAGLLHLHRRILGKGPSHPDVQTLVKQTQEILGDGRPGSASETGLLFPMFAVGCDVADESARVRMLERFRRAETSGMAQVRTARRLMERAWVTRRPWETLLTTEFIG